MSNPRLLSAEAAMRRHAPSLAAAACAALACATPAAAGELYLQGGFAGGGIGYAQPITQQFTVRADVMTIGHRSDTFTEEGIDYRGKLKLDRVALFGDWFVGGGGFRLTGGLGAHDARLDLTAGGAGQTVTIGSRTLVLTASDRFDVQIEYPTVMPYLGIGYGHHQALPGWGFVFDVGVFIGKAKVSGQASGAGFIASGLTQADVDAELQEIRDNAGDLKVLPQVTFGASYRF